MTQDKSHQGGASPSSAKPATPKPPRGEHSDTGTERDLLPELGLKRPAPPNASRAEAAGNKATRFDGNPNPKGEETGVLGPKDDTPAFLEKKPGPGAGRK